MTITPGDLEASELYRRISSDDDSGKRKVLAALDNLGYPVDVNDCLGEFAVTLSVHHGLRP